MQRGGGIDAGGRFGLQLSQDAEAPKTEAKSDGDSTATAIGKVQASGMPFDQAQRTVCSGSVAQKNDSIVR